MMQAVDKTIQIRDVVLGKGMPKICIPLVGITLSSLLEEARLALAAGADIVEWRMDFFDQVKSSAQVEDAARQLRTALGNTPLLATFRTVAEGGSCPMDSRDYLDLLNLCVEKKLVDMVDVELSAGETLCRQMAAACRENHIFLVLSSHDFSATPHCGELVRRLGEMNRLGAHIAKIAVMPHSAQDVLALLTATSQAVQELDIPVVTMAMGPLGAISRVAGEFFGSALTFGSARAASAPGQLDAGELRQVLDILHRAIRVDSE